MQSIGGYSIVAFIFHLRLGRPRGDILFSFQMKLTCIILDGYLNESGLINTKRLQMVLDHMDQWEREIFEREYSDLNWYKGKQRHHVKSAEDNINKYAGGSTICKSTFFG